MTSGNNWKRRLSSTYVNWNKKPHIRCIYSLIHGIKKIILRISVQYLLRPVAWEIRTRSSLCHDIFIVTALLLLPIRTLHLRPPPSGCLQRVDPFTVAPVWPAPESVTPSVDLRRFPANFISKLLIQLYRVRIQIARRFFLFSCIYAKK